MPQLFPRSANTVARVCVVSFPIALLLVAWSTYTVWLSPYMTRVDVPLQQPVPFSHRHHAGDLGIDCRYCHASVETSAFAGMPPTETCMTCHSQIWRDAPMLEPVRASLREHKPLQWTRVNDLPDFVYFDHSIHINRGIDCTVCHGPINQMPITWRGHTLYMKWCLECHRDPDNHIRLTAPPAWPSRAINPERPGVVAAKQTHDPEQLTDCSICHR